MITVAVRKAKKISVSWNLLKKYEKTTPTWKKSTNFIMVIALVEIEKIENEYPELVTKSPFQLWKEYITHDLLEKKLRKNFTLCKK